MEWHKNKCPQHFWLCPPFGVAPRYMADKGHHGCAPERGCTHRRDPKSRSKVTGARCDICMLRASSTDGQLLTGRVPAWTQPGRARHQCLPHHGTVCADTWAKGRYWDMRWGRTERCLRGKPTWTVESRACWRELYKQKPEGGSREHAQNKAPRTDSKCDSARWRGQTQRVCRMYGDV